MKKKILIGITIIFVIIIVSSGSILYLMQPVALSYTGTFSTHKGNAGAVAELKFYTNTVLYNCIATLTYTATNGSSVTITKQLGMVDINAMNLYIVFLLTDYTDKTNNSTQAQLTQTSPIEGIKINAHGFITPYIS